MTDHGLRPDYFADAWLSSEEAAQSTAVMLERYPEITALFGCNDEVASAAMRAAQALRRRGPEACLLSASTTSTSRGMSARP